MLCIQLWRRERAPGGGIIINMRRLDRGPGSVTQWPVTAEGHVATETLREL